MLAPIEKMYQNVKGKKTTPFLFSGLAVPPCHFHLRINQQIQVCNFFSKSAFEVRKILNSYRLQRLVALHHLQVFWHFPVILTGVFSLPSARVRSARFGSYDQTNLGTLFYAGSAPYAHCPSPRHRWTRLPSAGEHGVQFMNCIFSSVTENRAWIRANIKA